MIYVNTTPTENTLLKELDPDRKHPGGKFIKEKQDNYDLVIMLLDMGCRIMEASSLPWSAVDFNDNTIHLYRSKVNNESIIHMTDRLLEVMLRRYTNRENDRYVFTNGNGGHRIYSKVGITNAIKRAGLNDPEVVKEKGGRVTIHTLRHILASKLAQSGLPLHYIQQILGHSSITTTEIYAHLIPSKASKAATGVLNALQYDNSDVALIREGKAIASLPCG